MIFFKLEGVGPVDNIPTTNKLHYLKKQPLLKKTTKKYNMWHWTGDTWHATHDMGHMTGGGRKTFSQNFSYLALTVWEWSFVEDICTKDDPLSVFKLIVNNLNNHQGICRAAPATPGLLINLDAGLSFITYFSLSKYEQTGYISQKDHSDSFVKF